ncbi:MAG: hypothetical protein HKN71_06380 [Gemmatimonadetes bacterium]|nr:hypothetical protein [Gemmatimonadota bacterium]
MSRKTVRRARTLFALIAVAPLLTGCLDMTGIGDSLVEACEASKSDQPRMTSTLC